MIAWTSLLRGVVFGAVRATTLGEGSWLGEFLDFCLGNAGQRSGMANEFKETGISQTVKDIPPIPAGFQENRFPQGHQMLGDVGLSVAEMSLQVADTSFSLANG